MTNMELTPTYPICRSNWRKTNGRGQVTSVKLGAVADGNSVLELGLDWGSAQNNGNLVGQTIRIPDTVVNGVPTTYILNLVQSYGYDPGNRLTLATERRVSDNAITWQQGYTIDTYGNRTMPTMAGWTYSAARPTSFARRGAGWRRSTRTRTSRMGAFGALT
jgi:hypothetical protein